MDRPPVEEWDPRIPTIRNSLLTPPDEERTGRLMDWIHHLEDQAKDFLNILDERYEKIGDLEAENAELKEELERRNAPPTITGTGTEQTRGRESDEKTAS